MEQARTLAGVRSRPTKDTPASLLLVLAFSAAEVADIITTHVSLRAGAVEANPIAAYVLRHFGEPTLYSLKLGLVALVALTIVLLGRSYPSTWHALHVCTALVTVAVIMNVLTIASAVT